MSTASHKICLVCGEDCADKPRTKDNKGRYYCKGCYNKASAARPRPNVVLPAAPSAGPANFLDELISAAPPPVASTPCAQCGFAVPPGSHICMHCGFNAQTGRVMKARVIKPPRDADPNRAVWPIVVGIVSVVFGVGGSGLGAVQLTAAFMQYSSTLPMKFHLIRFGGGGLVLSLGLWLLLSGIGIIRRQSSAADSIRRWAIVKIAFFTLFIGGLAIAFANSGPVPRNARPGEVEGFIAGMGIVLLLIWLWMAAWPIFVLIWFSTSRVRDQVAQWD